MINVSFWFDAHSIAVTNVTNALGTMNVQMYSDLVLGGLYEVGGRGEWSGFIGSVSVLSFEYSPTAMTLASMTTMEHGTTAQYISCHNESALQLIFAQLVVPSDSATSITCGSDMWTVKLCASGLPSICIGCEDPCGLGCSDSNVINVESECRVSESVHALHVLGMNFQPTVPPPTFSLALANASRTALMVEASLSSRGSLYCGVFPPGSRPSSSQAIVFQRHFATAEGGSVKLSITSLAPLSSYDVYCVSTNPAGVMLPLTQALETRLTANTTCCKRASFELSTSTLRQGSSSANLVTLGVDFPPSESCVLTFSADDAGLDFIPSTVTWSPERSSPAGVSVFVSSSTVPGPVTLMVNFSGSCADEYSVVYSNGNVVSVIGAQAPLPPPSLAVVRFSNDGSNLIFVFDSPSNFGGIVATTFPCQSLVTFVGVDSAVCQWTSASQLVAYLGPTASVTLADEVELIRGIIKAPCVGPSLAYCSSWNATSAAAASIQPPANAMVPVVVISAPPVIGACTALTLDLSSSMGSGGREWASVAFLVGGSGDVNVYANITMFLEANYVMSPPTPIPAYLLRAGSLSIQITLCNFLGYCGTSSSTVSVLPSPAPLVTIFEKSMSTLNRNQSIALLGDAYVSACADGSAIRSNMAFTYKILESRTVGGSQVWVDVSSSITSVARNPSSFILPPFLLNVRTFYKIQLQAL